MNQPKRSKQQEPPEEPKDFQFPPIQNGIDYLFSVVELLTKHESEKAHRNLKYVILHLQAAVEVILKTRLQGEHWSLVVKDASKTNYAKYKAGDFHSVTPDEAIRRLIDVVGIEISKEERKELDELVKSRNALQHWGHTASANAIEVRAAKVLSFLIRFIDDELYDGIDPIEKLQVAWELDKIRIGLNKIELFTKRHLDNLEPTLTTAKGLRIHCPHCKNFTLILTDTVDTCYFCSQEWPLHELVDQYIGFSSGYDIHTLISEGERDPRHCCFECNQDTLVLGVVVDELSNETNLCFACVETFRDIEYCGGCGDIAPAIDGNAWCKPCLRNYTD